MLVKASAGGGGRGMRVVRELSALPGEVAAARREAQSAFGDPTVFCERYLPTGHHVEVQVLADTHGTVWAVGERECSIQRRHQKIIEEAPSPLVERTPGMRAKLFDAARLAAGAIGYTGAGTVEFLADDDGEFFFLEMNTRLQVEHPVTEETTGLDLVELQLAVADGGRLDAEPPAAHGHSIEARLYAEDPAQGWQPQAGAGAQLSTCRRSGPSSASLGQRTGIRLDSGIVDGSAVSIHYDPMLAKVISYAPTRRQAALVLADALARTRLHGVRTNRDLLVNVLRHPAFLDGATDTAFFDTHGLARAVRAAGRRRRASGCRRSPPRSPTPRTTARPQRRCSARSPAAGATCVGLSGQDLPRRRRRTSTASNTASPERDWCLPATSRCSWSRPRPTRSCSPTATGWRCRFAVARYGQDVYVDSALGPVHLVALPRFPEPGSAVETGLAGRAHARQRHPARRRGRRHASPPASR